MKITVFNGSPKGENSNTQIIVNAFLDGAREAKANVETVYLKDKYIEHCKGCFSCWYKTPGKCVYNDDMADLIMKYLESDYVCFATPIYTWNMTAHLKNFADRLILLKSPILTVDNGKYDLENNKKIETKFIVIANAGFPGENNFNTIKAVFSSCNPVLEIYRNSGMALKKDDIRIKEYLNNVKKLGFELISSKNVSYETFSKVNEDIIPIYEYVKMLGMNKAEK